MNVKVSTVAFSTNQHLVDRLMELFPSAQVNSEGKRISEDLLPEYFAGAEGIIVGLENINAKLLDQLPDLKIIAKYGVGLDNVDLEACRERNIVVGWTGGVNKRSVAEMALGFMLSLLRNLYSTSNQLKVLTWNKSGGVQLSGKTVGIIGLGHIGKELVRLLSPFNCNILANDIADVSEFVTENKLSQVSLDELFSRSDIVSIHTPLTSVTRNLIDAVSLRKMKPGAFVINTARGGIINENDLKFALLNKIISGAALDVYEVEPPIDRELLSLPNVICTPHTGGNSYEAVVAMGLSALDHLNNYKVKHKLS
ncbi:phosphoglycerate dehydrogenase [Daejeonella sp.]|uniref:phosphoglycerate dehydrogenase n=1 Tax=Daejeonella sp. TaxID=2805397 RepID=UPI002C85C1C4|nr:phosphoglycerate dehydrogenase [Daejeonella sp.]HQT58852.1 phosphoglycerate dehydrogenase [Daejeonella sp.]